MGGRTDILVANVAPV